MPIFSLVPHSDTTSSTVSEVTAQIAFGTGREIWVEFMIAPPAGVRFPEPTIPQRADNLWQSTCFELFLKPDGEERYFEFNLSPSREWAAYSFKSYRSGMREHPMEFDPEAQITMTQPRDYYWLSVDLPLPEGQWPAIRIGLSAVIEEQGGHKSYWALAHPDGPPDFHDPSCFIARLPE